jgi:hypothetical protein
VSLLGLFAEDVPVTLIVPSVATASMASVGQAARKVPERLSICPDSAADTTAERLPGADPHDGLCVQGADAHVPHPLQVGRPVRCDHDASAGVARTHMGRRVAVRAGEGRCRCPGVGAAGADGG